MPKLDERLADILAAIVEAYDAQPVDNRRRLMHRRSASAGERFLEWPEDGPFVGREDIDDLASWELLDVESNRQGSPMVKPTQYARDVIDASRREQALAERGGEVDFSWPAFMPVLKAAVDEWERIGGRALGAPGEAIAEALQLPADSTQLLRGFDVLAEGGWVELDREGYLESPAAVKPTPQALQAVRGWPGGDGEVQLQRLLLALDELVAEAPTPEARSHAEGFRATAVDFVRTFGVELAAKLAVGT